MEREENKVSGNILLFYAFDIGEEVKIDSIKTRGLLSTYALPQSAYFKDYHVPLAFHLLENRENQVLQRTDAILNKLHHFGIVSFCYKVPFDDSFDNVKEKIIVEKQKYDEQSEKDARLIFDTISSEIVNSNFSNMKNDYFAVHVNPIPGKFTADDFKEMYGAKIASLLRLETQTLADYQQDEILSSITGYYGQDMIIIDSEGSFIYDDEFFEPMEFFESTNIQKLVLQYYDRFLDKQLNYFYQQKQHKIPFSAAIPLLGQFADSPVARLARVRVDISVITERLEYSIKRAGDAYYSNLYTMLVEKMSIRDWRDSINRKLEILGDLRQVYHSQLDTIHDEILTLVIIILIALEVFFAFLR